MPSRPSLAFPLRSSVSGGVGRRDDALLSINSLTVKERDGIFPLPEITAVVEDEGVTVSPVESGVVEKCCCWATAAAAAAAAAAVAAATAAAAALVEEVEEDEWFERWVELVVATG